MTSLHMKCNAVAVLCFQSERERKFCVKTSYQVESSVLSCSRHEQMSDKKKTIFSCSLWMFSFSSLHVVRCWCVFFVLGKSNVFRLWKTFWMCEMHSKDRTAAVERGKNGSIKEIFLLLVFGWISSVSHASSIVCLDKMNLTSSMMLLLVCDSAIQFICGFDENSFERFSVRIFFRAPTTSLTRHGNFVLEYTEKREDKNKELFCLHRQRRVGHFTVGTQQLVANETWFYSKLHCHQVWRTLCVCMWKLVKSRIVSHLSCRWHRACVDLLAF